MTVGQFKASTKGYQEKIVRQMRLQDQLNHSLGRYIAIGTNNPKKYPKKPFMDKSEDNVKRYKTDDEYERISRMKYGKK